MTLPYRARLTPLAADFVRARKLILGYSQVSAPTSGAGIDAAAPASTGPVASAPATQSSPAPAAAAGTFVWWCDGPCGPAKAAVVTEEKQSALRAMHIKAHPTLIVPVIKALAGEVKAGKIAGGVLLVQSAAPAIVFANRCPSLRAVIGTCLESVEQGITQVAANVLIIEYPHKTLQQIRNMLSRFLRAPRALGDDLKRQIEEFAQCG